LTFLAVWEGVLSCWCSNKWSWSTSCCRRHDECYKILWCVGESDASVSKRAFSLTMVEPTG